LDIIFISKQAFCPLAFQKGTFKFDNLPLQRLFAVFHDIAFFGRCLRCFKEEKLLKLSNAYA